MAATFMENGAVTSSPLSPTPERPSFLLPTSTTGFVLKKWKRIKRNSLNLDSHLLCDNNRALKRDFSMSAHSLILSQPPGSNPLPQDSAGSSNMNVDNFHVDVFSMADDGHKFQLETVTGLEFSRNSEDNNDKSSQSSSAISAPKSSTAKGGKRRIETTKKLRGDTIKIDKGSSNCSGESESGSNFIVVQNVAFLYTDGMQTRNSTDNGEGSVDGAQQSDEQTKMYQNSGNSLDDSADGLSLEDDTTIMSSDASPFSSYPESILRFQIVYEAVENELNKLMELTTLARSLKPTSSTATILEEEVCQGGEVENEKLFRNLVEAEIENVIMLGGVGEAQKLPPKGVNNTIVFRKVSCFFIQLILLVALLLCKALPPHSTTTPTPTVLPT